MKLFLDRNKTLLPRIDVIYLLTRILALAGFALFTFLGPIPREEAAPFYIILGTFFIHLIVFYAAVKEKFDIKLAYFSAILFDLILIPFMIQNTGVFSSSFYLMYFLTISVAAYVLTFWFATTIALVASLSYVVFISSHVQSPSPYDIAIRLGFIWSYFLAISYASEHLRRNEKRLLKLFDTLNQRTSELEKSQAHLEMIYENSRILASMLDTESVVKEIMKIMGAILGYDSFAIIIKDRTDKLYFRARSENGENSFHPRLCPPEGTELVRKIIELGEPACLKNILTRFDYKPLSADSRSLMIVPLTSHSTAMGVLVAESNVESKFHERDVQMLLIVARSAALALENAALHRRTEELTINDELTETFNYRFFVQKLQEEKRRAVRYNLPLSIIMVDIDWFKKLNDSYGHEIGNLVLKYLSDIIKNCIRDVDIFCRYGGEEFVIILPQTPQVEATQIAERIRQQTEKAVIDTGKHGKLKVTVSVGITSYPENGKSQDDLLAVADQAMYRAKGEGRNLVRII